MLHFLQVNYKVETFEEIGISADCCPNRNTYTEQVVANDVCTEHKFLGSVTHSKVYWLAFKWTYNMDS